MEREIKELDKVAIIDLGSNTFHLLIAEIDSKREIGFTTIYKHRDYVKLASHGKSFIESEAFARGIKTMQRYNKRIQHHQVKYVKALGTAMLRKASNAQAFIDEVKSSTNIQINVIDGQKEAHLIGMGVKICFPKKYLQKAVIMDIGGGSVEFILVNQGTIGHVHSFPIGIAILKQKFHQDEPFQEDSLRDLKSFLNTVLAPVIKEIKAKQYTCLIGCSGTFEVLVDSQSMSQCSWSAIDIGKTLNFIQQIKQMTHYERLNHPGIPEERADLIVVATVLIEFLLSELGIQALYYSPFAMKEGALAEFVINNNI